MKLLPIADCQMSICVQGRLAAPACQLTLNSDWQSAIANRQWPSYSMTSEFSDVCRIFAAYVILTGFYPTQFLPRTGLVRGVQRQYGYAQ